MAHAAIPVLNLTDDALSFSRAIGDSFREYGFALVADHGIDPALIARGWQLAKAFFALPEAEKRALHLPGQGGARGYTPFGTEIAKDAQVQDLKEFWHVGRDVDGGKTSAAAMPKNIWPERPKGFRDTFTQLFLALDQVGEIILERIAIDLGLPRQWFDAAARQGNSVLRLAHYPPVPDDPGGAVRAAPHEDINLITLLLGAEESGLELLGKDGSWHAINPPDGALVVNIGDMLQRLTNHVLPSTTHRVRNPEGARAHCSRYSMPFFVHLRSEYVMRTLPQCVTAANPDRYPTPITADSYLQERLREIGLTG